MAVNSSTFNFKKRIPTAAILSLLLILAIELCSFSFIRTVKQTCKGGDLIKLDGDLFCGEFKQYSHEETYEIRQKYGTPSRESLTDLGKRGPYDLIVFGDSTGSTGWPEILQSSYSMRVANLTPKFYADGWPYEFVRLAKNYPKVNGKQKAIWLFSVLTEGRGESFLKSKSISVTMQNTQGEKKDHDRFPFPTVKLIKYFKLKKALSPDRLKLIKIQDRIELFYGTYSESSGADKKITRQNYAKLKSQLIEARYIAQQNDADLVFVAFPTKPQQYEWLINPQGERSLKSQRRNLHIVRHITRSLGIPFLDMESALKPLTIETYKKTGRLFWFQDDTHMNLEGAAYSAQIIAQFLTQIKEANHMPTRRLL